LPRSSWRCSFAADSRAPKASGPPSRAPKGSGPPGFIMLPPILSVLVHLLVIATLPPLLLGVIARTKAVFAGRVGAPLLQPYYDLFKLLRKGSVFSTTTTSIFRLSPVVAVVTAFAASLFVPFGPDAPPLSFAGDLIFFAYVMGLSRFFTIAA